MSRQADGANKDSCAEMRAGPFRFLERAGKGLNEKLLTKPNGGEAMEAEDDTTVTDGTEATTVTEDDPAETQGTEDGGETSGEDTPETTVEKDKLPKDAPEWAVKRIGKLTAKRHEAETAQTLAEKERDAYKAEAETVKAKYGDRDILAAARRTGILPELLSTEEAKTLTRADDLQKNIEGLEQALDDYPEGYEADGKTVTPQQMRSWLRAARNEFRDISDDAGTLRKAKAETVRELIRLGKEAKAAGWKPGDGSRKPGDGGRKAPPVKVKPGSGTAAAEAAGPRRAATAATSGKATDFSKVKTQDDLVAEMAKKYGG